MQSSTRRPSCRRKVVPLHFVLNPQESFRRFLNEFNKITVSGHMFREVGAYYFLTRDSFIRKFHGSLEPPLGSAANPQEPEVTHGNLSENVSVMEASTNLELNTPVDEVENEINKMTIDSTPNIMMDSTTTLVSSNADYFDAESDSPMMKTPKRRFESGSTSILGKNWRNWFAMKSDKRIRQWFYLFMIELISNLLWFYQFYLIDFYEFV